MKTRILIIATICCVQGAAPLLAAERTLENQFRIDFEAIIRRAWKVPSDERAEEVRREVDQMVEGIRIHRPLFLRDGEKAPTDDDLQRRWDELVAFERSFSGRGFPLWEHYIPLWKAGKLNPEQKLIFSRMIGFLVQEHEERTQQREGKKG